MIIKPRLAVLLFKPRFVAPIREGRKRQTIRLARAVKAGDVLSLRAWADKPYRSPQVEIGPPVACSSVAPIRVAVDVWQNAVEIEVGGERLTHDEVCAFVRADGFSCVSDMADYYDEQGTLDFDGVLIQWEATPDA